jgi:hypothetical protein
MNIVLLIISGLASIVGAVTAIVVVRKDHSDREHHSRRTVSARN